MILLGHAQAGTLTVDTSFSELRSPIFHCKAFSIQAFSSTVIFLKLHDAHYGFYRSGNQTTGFDPRGLTYARDFSGSLSSQAREMS